MTAEYTVPALRDQATKLRRDADAITAAAQVEAEKYRVAANELDTIADGIKNQPAASEPAPFTLPCWNCGKPVYKDALGWAHANPSETACQVPGADKHTAAKPADSVTPTPTLTDGLDAGEVAGK